MNEVEAVKSKVMIEKIENRLTSFGQVYADVWRFGINSGLRIGDLLTLRFDDVSGDSLEVTEQKTRKRRSIPINPTMKRIIQRRQQDNPHHTYLFQTDANRSKGAGKPIARGSVSRIFKQVGEGASIGIKLGTHSMRKTLGYQMYQNGCSLELICKVLNHSSPTVTMRYIGIEKEDVASAYIEL
ncbi:tyrosine-type recombinase/integrase [Halovibrio sp. HP20-50]|uniref:tyrosine-type recombinase/integrase n=1 Tax=Halovibrio sp. HP20-59 TaxID=3080275 RepID=UPI00294B1DB6|nr:tyrosine-type recombinase/integrase [Halovibrio sp. HP20-59]MEA2120568.1 tyrosine-type recombinase/integrase [Halovibrio sp. HP20-59]